MKRLIAACFLLASSPAWAGNLYIGAGIGTATATDASTNLSSGAAALTSLGISSNLLFDKNATAYSVSAGYQFNKNFGVEAAYYDLGSYQFTGTYSAGGASITVTENDKVTVMSFSGVLSVPIEKDSTLYTKMGVASSTNKETCTVQGFTCKSFSDSGTGSTFGAGASLSFSEHNAIRIEYDAFNDIGDINHEYTAGNFWLVKLDLIYSF